MLKYSYLTVLYPYRLQSL